MQILKIETILNEKYYAKVDDIDFKSLLNSEVSLYNHNDDIILHSITDDFKQVVMLSKNSILLKKFFIDDNKNNSYDFYEIQLFKQKRKVLYNQ